MSTITADESKYVPEQYVEGGRSYADVSEVVSKPLESFPTWRWWVCFLVALGTFGLGAVLSGIMFAKGLGVLGLNQPAGWGVFIVNFVFWANKNISTSSFVCWCW